MDTRTKKDFFENEQPEYNGPEYFDALIEEILTHAKNADNFAIVGVTEDANEVEKRKKYLKKAWRVHPDRNPAEKAKDAFQALQDAYEKISNMQKADDDELAVAEHAGLMGIMNPDKSIQLISLENDALAPKTVSEAEWEATKKKHAMERLKRRRGGRIAPPEIRKIYEEAHPLVLELLRDPLAEEAKTGITSCNSKIPDETRPFQINISFLEHLAKQAILLRKRISDDPNDVKAREDYGVASLQLQKHGELFGWPKEWQLEPIPETDSPNMAFFGEADKYVRVLQQNPQDQEAADKLKELNHKRLAQLQNSSEMDTDGVVRQVDFEELANFYMQWNNLIASFKRNPEYTVIEAAHELNDKLKAYISQQGYPQSWAMQLPSALELGAKIPTSNVPTTRQGHPILAYRSWKIFHTMAYLFAVLDQQHSPIGVIISGSEMGYDSRTKYLNHPESKRIERCEKESPYEEPKLLYVFERLTRKETWVIFTTAADRKHQIAMSLSEYKIVRKGKDALYDIQNLCKEKDVPFPSSLDKDINKLGKSLRPPRPTDSLQTRLLESRDAVETRSVTAEELLHPRKREQEHLRRQGQRTREVQTVDRSSPFSDLPRDQLEAVLQNLIQELQVRDRPAGESVRAEPNGLRGLWS